MLRLESTSVSYGAIQALHELDLYVDAGECVALLGANGAGKSSTLRAASRMVSYRGTITFNGQDLRRRSPEWVARAGLVHVPEGRHVFPNLTAHENLLVGQSTHHTGAWACTLSDIYDLFPALKRLRNRPGWALSGGEQQMVAIGRGLLAGPDLLMLDEPSLGLAPVVVSELFDVLEKLRSRLTMLIVEQSTTVALALCDRAYVLRRGRVAVSGTPAELQRDGDLLNTYLADAPTTTTIDGQPSPVHDERTVHG